MISRCLYRVRVPGCPGHAYSAATSGGTTSAARSLYGTERGGLPGEDMDLPA
jgi:hypothetical protein